MKKIVFTGGGTLGHVMPNLYLIEELKDDYECFYIGSGGIEKQKVDNNVKYFEIPATKLERGKFFKNFKIPFVLFDSIFKSKKILSEIGADVVFSKGGYVSLPVCIAAKLLKIPIIAHESDYSLGLANKIILRLCDKMCVNFKNLEDVKKKIVYTGPVFSKDYEKTTKYYSGFNLNVNRPTISIVCGSLGSRKINDCVYGIIKDLLKDFNIIHITGKGNKKVESYGNYNAFEMIDDMVNLYNISDFVIGRSGAGVTAECYFKKLPMLLIPLENKATRGDQLLNAKYYENLGVAKIIKENDLTENILLKETKEMKKNLLKYEEKYKQTKTVNGKALILDIIKQIEKKN